MDDRKDIELRIRTRYEGKKTLSELTTGIKELGEAQEKQLADAKKGAADVKALDTTYQKLERSLKAVAAIYADTTRYESQQAALAKTAERLELAKQKQEAFDRSLTKGAELTDKQVREQTRLGNAVDRATAAMAKAQSRLDSTTAKLKAYGINTDKIGDAQARMAVTVLEGNAALARQEAAIDGATTATKRLASGETAAALGRIKAQVIALASAWVGVHQATRLAAGSVDAFSNREGIKNQLALSVGDDRAAIDAEYEYVKAQADRIGIEFERAAKGYAKFSAAARLAGRDQKEIRFIWESFAEVGRVANLSAEDLDGVFKALEQITSKGKIQAEELRGQLGDRLFGAFQVAAKALKDQFPDLDKALKDGVVTSEQLVAIAEEYRRTVADQLPEAVKSLSAEQARMTNAVTDFKQAIADAGFADAYRAALVQITEALRSDDGKKFAEGTAAAFSALADAAVWVLEHLNEVTAVLKALAGILALRTVSNAAADVADYSRNLKALAADLKTTVKGLGLLRGSFAVLQAAVIGWSIGSYLSDEFAIVRKGGIYMATGLEEAWQRIKYGAQLAFELLPTVAHNAMVAVVNAVTRQMRNLLLVFQAAARSVGLTDLDAAIGGAIGTLTLSYRQETDRAAQIRKALEQELKQIRRIRGEMLADADRAPAPTRAPQIEPTPRPDTTRRAGAASGGAPEKSIAARQRLVDEITRALETLDAKIDRSQTDTLQAQLEAIDTTYAALSRKIAALGGSTGAEFMARLEQSLNQLRAQTIAKFNDGLTKEHEALLSKLEGLDAAAGRKSKTDLQARLEAIRSQYEGVYREITDFRAKLEANGRSTGPADTARQRLDAGIAELKQLETQRFYKDELKRLEGEINGLLSTRSDRLKTIADQEAASLITSAEARSQTEATITAIQPQIESLATSAAAFAEQLRGAFDPIAIDAFIAKLELAKASGQGLGETFKLTGRQVEEMIANRSLQAFDAMTEAIGGAVVGTRSWGDALRATGAAFAKFAADFLREIAQMIIKAAILKAIQNSGAGGAIGGAISAAVRHDGGLVSAGGRSRQVSPMIFMQAPRYHTGGLVGLRPDEYPAILQRNEEVLSTGDPRNVINGGGAQGQPTPPQDVQINNYVDAVGFMTAATASPAGRRVIMNVLSAERATLRQLIGG